MGTPGLREWLTRRTGGRGVAGNDVQTRYEAGKLDDFIDLSSVISEIEDRLKVMPHDVYLSKMRWVVGEIALLNCDEITEEFRALIRYTIGGNVEDPDELFERWETALQG